MLDISRVEGLSLVHALFLPSIYHTALNFQLREKKKKKKGGET